MDRSVIKDIRHLDLIIKVCLSQGHEPLKIFNYTQIQVLRYLFSHMDENICQKDLEIVTGLKKASMTGCLNVLEEKGCIFRETADDDKRRNHIRLSEMMKKKGEILEERGKTLDELIISNISEEDLNAFFRVIDSVRENVLEIEKNGVMYIAEE